MPLLVADPPDGDGRDLARSEVLFLLSSKRTSNESRISFSRPSLPQSMMLRTYWRNLLRARQISFSFSLQFKEQSCPVVAPSYLK